MMFNFNSKDNSDILSVKALIKIQLNTALKTLPPELDRFIRDYGIVAGGISASLFHSEKVNDIDVYLKTDSAIEAFKRSVQMESVKSHIADVNENYTGKILIPGKCATANAVTFECGIQVITMLTSDSRSTFDFLHTLPYYDIAIDRYFISRAEYDSIKEKKLIRNKNPKAFKPLEKRIQKFIDRGWSYDENP